MEPKTSIYLKVLINRYHPKASSNFLKNFSPEDTKEVFSNVTISENTSLAFSWQEDLISRTHYSWLAPHLQKMPLEIQTLIVNALPETQAKGLQKLLKIPAVSKKINPHLKNFLINHFYRLWRPNEALPPEYLPESQLSTLLSFSKTQLVELIDLLAMYDLSESIRHIVDKKKLKSIYFCLSPNKQQFLRICLHKKEKLIVANLEIEKWNGDAEELKSTLHKRGIARLGKALCGQHKQFLWNIIHKLDTGRGNAISHYYQENPLPNITHLLLQQVISVINFLNNKSDS